MRTCGEDRPTERVGDTPRCENQGPESDQFMLVVTQPKSSCGRVRLMPGSPLPVLSGYTLSVAGQARLFCTPRCLCVGGVHAEPSAGPGL